MQKDRIQNDQLQELGYTVFRFWTEEVKRNLKASVNQVLLYVESAREINIPAFNS